jgi:hypothetical protein
VPLTPHDPLAAWTHEPLLHASLVHTLPSVQALASLATKTHNPLEVLQASSVHGLLSLQITGLAPTHTPLWQASTVVQALPSVQDVPLVAFGLEQTPVPVLQTPATWH